MVDHLDHLDGESGQHRDDGQNSGDMLLVPDRDALNMRDEAGRLETFFLRKWPDWAPVACEKLAKAGFYYSGIDDEVVCPFCDVRIRDWQFGESPIMTHKREDESCPFIASPANCGNVALRNFRNRSHSGTSSRSGSASGASASGIVGHRRNTSLSSNASGLLDSCRGIPSGRTRHNDAMSVSAFSGLPTPRFCHPQGTPSPTSTNVSATNGGNNGSFIATLDHRREADRLKTFRQWPNLHVLPSELARSGFFYVGPHDSVECAFCHLRLEGWQMGDSPIMEHTRYSPQCDFVCNPEDVGNEPLPQDPADAVVMTNLSSRSMPSFDPNIHTSSGNGARRSGHYSMSTPDIEFFASHHHHHPRYERRALPASARHASVSATINTTEPRVESRLVSPESPEYKEQMESLGIFVSPPCCPEMATFSSRLQSFFSWPPDHPQKPQELATAGFYYLGSLDDVKCFHCNGGLREWLAEDEVWEEHAKHFPQCPFLRSCRGEQFVRAVQEDLVTGMPQAHRSSRSRVIQSPTTEDAPTTFNQLRSRGVDTDHAVILQVLEFGYSEELICRAISDNSNKIYQNVADLVDAIEALKRRAEARKRGEAEQQPVQEEKSERHVCKVCLDKEVCIVFLPCGHLCCCELCAPPLSICPICRSEKKGFVRAYL